MERKEWNITSSSIETTENSSEEKLEQGRCGLRLERPLGDPKMVKHTLEYSKATVCIRLEK